MSLIADTLDDDHGRFALEQLRSARRKNRLEHIDWFDAFYKAYVSAILAAAAIYAAAGAFGDAPLNSEHLDAVRVDGPAWLAVVVAMAIGVGLRSGGRGGPLAFEAADVRHVLMAPVDRRFSIRKPAFRHLRHSLFLGLATGSAAGLVASRRMPEHPGEWVAFGALFGAGTALLASGAAMFASGHRLKTWMTDVLSLLILAWSVVDVVSQMNTSPLTWLSHVAVWPLDLDPLGVAGLLVSLVVAAVGLSVSNRCSIEAAERRSRLVGQLRFAATLQDIRTVMVLQRQLAQEQTRQRPWIRLPRSKKLGYKNGRVKRSVFYRRGLHGILRWPALRVFRLLIFIALAGFAVLGMWGGTSALVVVAGLATWLAALDLCEPLAQEVDHPDRLRSTGQPTGIVLVQHATVPFLLMALLVLLGCIPAIVWGGADIVVALWPVAVFIAATAVGGATLAVNARPAGASGVLETPEIASVKFAVRVLLPPGVAIVGFLPVLAASDSWGQHHNVVLMVQAANPWLLGALAAAGCSIGWLRYGDQVRDSIANAAATTVPPPATTATKGSKKK